MIRLLPEDLLPRLKVLRRRVPRTGASLSPFRSEENHGSHKGSDSLHTHRGAAAG